MIVEAVYGHRITSLEDRYVTMMDHAMEATTKGTSSGSVLDIFPVCEYHRACGRRQGIVLRQT